MLAVTYYGFQKVNILFCRNIAKCNAINFPEHHFIKEEPGKLKYKGGESKAGIRDLFRKRVIAGRTFNMFFQWASTRYALQESVF